MRLVRATKSRSAVAPVSASATGDFPGGGALRLIRATKSRSAVAPVSASATGDVEAIGSYADVIDAFLVAGVKIAVACHSGIAEEVLVFQI